MTLWKNWIKAYWVAMHGPEMSIEQALSELNEHNFLGDARAVFESDISLREGLETQLKLYRAALVAINKGEDLSKVSVYPRLEKRIKWFSPECGVRSLLRYRLGSVCSQFARGAHMDHPQLRGDRMHSKTDAIVTLVRNATADISKPFCKNAEKLYPNGEPIYCSSFMAHTLIS